MEIANILSKHARLPEVTGGFKELRSCRRPLILCFYVLLGVNRRALEALWGPGVSWESALGHPGDPSRVLGGPRGALRGPWAALGDP